MATVPLHPGLWQQSSSRTDVRTPCSPVSTALPIPPPREAGQPGHGADPHPNITRMGLGSGFEMAQPPALGSVCPMTSHLLSGSSHGREGPANREPQQVALSLTPGPTFIHRNSPTQICAGHILGEPGVEQGDQPEVAPPLLPPQARGRGPGRAGQRVLDRTQIPHGCLPLHFQGPRHKPSSFKGCFP